MKHNWSVGGWVAVAFALAAGSAIALDWKTGPGCRYADVSPSGVDRVGFTLLSSIEAGIAFTNLLSRERFVTNQIYLNGAGVALGDVDGDGWCDILLCGLDRPNALYRNLGHWKFKDVTAAAGVGCTNKDCTGAAFADVDGDGDLDLIINSVGNGTFIYINDGKGQFSGPAHGSPLNYLRAGMSLALADVDNDGDLDLYVANYRTTTIRDMPNTRLRLTEENGRPVLLAVNDRPVTEADLVGRFTLTTNGKIVENGEPDVLFLNDGKGGFTPVSWTGGAFIDEDGRPLKEPPYDWSLTATFRDINGDGAPDIYVCSDFSAPDRIWINDGGGHFRAIERLAIRTTSIFSMGVDFADVNRDGFLDFFVSDMLSRDHSKRMLELGDIQPTHLAIGAIDDRPQYSHNTLFACRGDGTYAEISQFSGVQASEWTWSPNFLDVDLDGYEDLLITTGHELQMMNTDIINRAEVMKAEKKMTSHELQRLRTMFPRYAIPNAAFRNRGDLTFEDVSAKWGFNTPDVGNSMAMADLDNDGDLDVVVNNLNGLAELYRNDGGGPRVAVRLKGLPPNTQGIGAKVTLLGGPVERQTQEIICGGRYLAGGEAVRVFAVGSATNRLSLEVVWRDGKRSVVEEVMPNRVYEVDQARAQVIAPPPPAAIEPAFENVTALLGHEHHEDPFDDFARQPLLPNRLSQLGPGVAWIDLDEDGWDDLVVGSGKGGRLAYYHSQGNGFFHRITDGPLGRQTARDQTAILGLGSVLLVGSANYEDGLTNGGCIRIYDLSRKVAGESILGHEFSTGPIAFGDVDGDGDLDLFIGGRVLPGRYPEPAASLLMKKEGDRLVVAQRFDRLGLASGAVFSDLDGDGTPELLVACEWGPVRVFRLVGSEYRDVTGELGLARFTGWWNGVATGDFDGDGRLDIVASNWGLNSRYRPTVDRPIRIHYGDFDENGTVDVVESYIDPATGKEVPARNWRAVSAALPFLQEKITSYQAYGKVSLEDLYGERLKAADMVEANTLESMVFLNRGDRFEPVVLPGEAQWAPAFGVCVGDMDGDGAEDIFLSQNFFAVNPDDWRHDAGRGLWLKGDGHGAFVPVPGQSSGVAVYGEQRGCAVSDYDADGRLDLVVTQNGNATTLWRNIKAKPGLRVRLKGPPPNPQAFGASVRLKFSERFGPIREIQGGSGYWSLNSAVQVMATPEAPTEVWIKWPGGKTTVSGVPAQAREIGVDVSGSVKAVR